MGDEEPNSEYCHGSVVAERLIDKGESPFDNAAHEEVRAKVEQELRKVSDPYRTVVILRDLEGMSYEEIAEIMRVSLGTVKSRLTRGREKLRKRLESYVRESGQQLGLEIPGERELPASGSRSQVAFEVAP